MKQAFEHFLNTIFNQSPHGSVIPLISNRNPPEPEDLGLSLPLGSVCPADASWVLEKKKMQHVYI